MNVAALAPLRRGLLLALTAALLLAGCAGVTGIPTAALRVGLADFHVESLGLFEQTLRLVLRIQNPNDIEVDINTLAVELDVNGRSLARGLGNQPLRIKPHADTTVEVATVTYTANVLVQVRELNLGRRDSIDYRLHGRLNLASGGSMPFEQLGEIPVKSLFGARDTDRR